MWLFKRRSILLVITVIGAAAVFFLLRQLIQAYFQKSHAPDKTEGALFEKGESYLQKAQYDSALYFFKASGSSLRKAGRWADCFHSLIKSGDILRIKGDFPGAGAYADSAGQVMKQHLQVDPLINAELLHLQGTIRGDQGNFEEAIATLRESIDFRIRKNGEDDTLLSNSYNNIGNNYFYLGKTDLALENYKKALEISGLRKQQVSPEVAMYYQNVGIIYAIGGDYAKAREYFNRNLSINKAVLNPDDPDLAKIYLNFGRLCNISGNIEDALGYYDQAEKIYLTKFGGNYLELGNLYMNMGTIYSARSDYEKALLYFNKAYLVFHANLTPDHPQISKVLMNIGYIWEMKESYDKALGFYFRSLPKDPASGLIVKTYRNIGSCYSRKKMPEEARRYYLLSIDQALKSGQEDPELALCYLDYGNFLMGQGDQRQPPALFSKALEIFRNKFGDKNRDVSNCLTHLGNHYFGLKQYDKALQHYQEALVAIIRDYHDTSVKSNPPAGAVVPDYFLLNALTQKARALYASCSDPGTCRQLLEYSLETWDLATMVTDKMISTFSSEESKLLISGQFREAYSNAIYIASTLFEKTQDPAFLEKAWKFSEKSKSVLLLAALKDAEARQVSNIPADLQDKEKQLKASITSNEKLIYEENQKLRPDAKRIQIWDSQLFDLKKSYDSLIGKIEKRYPEYYALKYEHQVIPASGIRKKLTPDQALLEYSVSDSTLFIFVITGEGSTLRAVPVDSSFYRDIRDLRASFRIDFSENPQKEYASLCRASHGLYNFLIAPVASGISGKALVIVPDDKLGYVPFEALLSRLPDTTRIDFRNLDYLIRAHPVSYTYLATLRYKEMPVKKTKGENLVAFAPTYENNAELKKNSYLVSRGLMGALGPIPWAKAEIENIPEQYRTRLYTGENATEENFKKVAGRYDIIHLAMHTLVDDENPMFSKMVFTVRNHEKEDDFLNTYETYGLDLRARLLVLSSCNTGSGQLRRGEGVMSLARGFLYAGVPSIVMTLWDVEDESGARIMPAFYRYLEEGMTKDAALQKAKLEFLNNADQQLAHPYFWSAFVLIGDNQPMELRSGHYTWIWITAALLLASGIALSLRYARKRNFRK